MVKVIAVKPQEQQAWAAYKAMLLAEKERPELGRNPVWIKHRDNCYADWFRQFEVA